MAHTSPFEGETGVAVTRETIFDFDAPLHDHQGVCVVAFAAVSTSLSIRQHWSPDNDTLTVFYLSDLPADTEIMVDVYPCAPDALVAAFALRFQTLSTIPLLGTELCGRVFASELKLVNLSTNGTRSVSVNVPLEGVTVTVDGRTDLVTRTDTMGNFYFSSFPAGRVFVHINGKTSTQAPTGAYYPNVGKAWVAQAGRLNEIGDVFLPLVKEGTLQPVSMTEETVIKMSPGVLEDFPEFGNVTIRVPPDSLYSNSGSRGGMVGIAPVDPNRLPGEPPAILDFAIIITVQTDGATNFDVPVQVCFPNLPTRSSPALQPGDTTALLSFDHDVGRFLIVGSAQVTDDGSLVCSTNGSGIRAPGWHGVVPVSNCCEELPSGRTENDGSGRSTPAPPGGGGGGPGGTPSPSCGQGCGPHPDCCCWKKEHDFWQNAIDDIDIVIYQYENSWTKSFGTNVASLMLAAAAACIEVPHPGACIIGFLATLGSLVVNYLDVQYVSKLMGDKKDYEALLMVIKTQSASLGCDPLRRRSLLEEDSDAGRFERAIQNIPYFALVELSSLRRLANANDSLTYAELESVLLSRGRAPNLRVSRQMIRARGEIYWIFMFDPSMPSSIATQLFRAPRGCCGKVAQLAPFEFYKMNDTLDGYDSDGGKILVSVFMGRPS